MIQSMIVGDSVHRILRGTFIYTNIHCALQVHQTTNFSTSYTCRYQQIIISPYQRKPSQTSQQSSSITNQVRRMELTIALIMLLLFFFVLVTADLRTAVRIATPTLVEALFTATSSPLPLERRGLNHNETAGLAEIGILC